MHNCSGLQLVLHLIFIDDQESIIVSPGLLNCALFGEQDVELWNRTVIGWDILPKIYLLRSQQSPKNGSSIEKMGMLW